MSTTKSEERVTRRANGNPNIRTTNDIMQLYAERIEASPRALKLGLVCTSEMKDSISFNRDTLTHYGHFPLARIIRSTPNGRAKLVLLNGDSYAGAGGYGPSTSSRQSEIRSIVKTTDVPYIILPFSTLDAAGIEESSVTPVHVRDDRTTYHDVIVSERPGEFVKVEHPDGLTEPHEVERHGYVHTETGEVRSGHAVGASDGYTWRPYTVTEQRQVMVNDEGRAHVEHHSSRHGWVREPAELQPDGRWKFVVQRHWLGDSLFKGRVTENRTRKPNPAELRQAADAERTHEAYEKARTAYYGVYADLSDDKRTERWSEVERLAVERTKFPDGYSGGVIAYRVTRWAYFLSSFDYNEPHAPYFMCEMPRSFKGETVDEAVAALMPDDVLSAIGAGLDVLRQGDIFAIPTAYTTSELESRAKAAKRTRYQWVDQQGAPGQPTYAPGHSVPVESRETIRRFKAEGTWEPKGACDIHGTNHSVTHLIVTKDGEFFGRGRMYHTPGESWRRPEHRVLDLTGPDGGQATWYRLVKNTVPLAKGQRGSRSSTVFQSGQSRAWTLGGMVD
ncbi:MAG TPA: hypothetical protein VK631_22220 [Solirubrobacteraceae bacterium]|nr:hypothetical protein [Solirubrobacteraceae bacterium]